MILRTYNGLCIRSGVEEKIYNEVLSDCALQIFILELLHRAISGCAQGKVHKSSAHYIRA